MSTTAASSMNYFSITSDAPTTFSDQFKLLDQRTLYADPSGDVELVAIHGDDSRTFCVSSHAMRRASPAWRAMLDPANGFKEASLKEPVKLHDDDFEALFILLLASHLEFSDVPAKVDFNTLFEICVVVDKYDCIGVLSPWLPRWVSELATKSHMSEHGPEWSFIAWVTGHEEIFKCTTDRILFSCKTNDTGQCINGSGDILDHVLPPGVPDNILNVRFDILTALIVDTERYLKTFSSGDGSTCNGIWRRGECQAYNLGQFYTQLLKINCLGDAKSVVPKLRDRSIEDVAKAIKGIHKHMQPNRGPHKNLNKNHASCGFSGFLNVMVDSCVYGAPSRTDIVTSSRNHLTAQLRKLKPSGIHLVKYQTRVTPRGS